MAWLLDLKYRTFTPDAISHMANGFYILYSRDRHLAAVGFVWQPLQSIADMVFLLGNHLWPALSHNDMAGSLVSGLAMAGAAYQILAASREWGVSRIPRLVLTACFALNPMMVLYAANGMSEGLYVFTLVASTRYLIRWIQNGDVRSLAYASVALAFSYLARNEALGGVALGTVCVAVVSFSRTGGVRLSRIKTAVADVTIFAAPAFLAVAGWATMSYVISGVFFAQLSSIYNTATLDKYTKLLSFHGRLIYEVHAVGALAPLLPVLLVGSAGVALVKRDWRVLAPLGVLGGALLFDLLALLNNDITNSFRYFIIAFPLGVLLVASLIAALQAPRTARLGSTTRTSRGASSSATPLRALAAVVLTLVVMTFTAATTASAIFNPNVGVYESVQLGFIFHAHPSQSDIKQKNNYDWILAIGDWFASRHLPDGDVVVDNFTACVPPLITTINQPRLFVIPNDRDFERILADPISFHAQYILESDPQGAAPTAVSIEYPNLWNTGAGFTKMVHQFPSARRAQRCAYFT